MYNDILDRYRKGYVTAEHLAEYVRLNVITPEQQQTILNDGAVLTLEQAKAQRIAESKADLAVYLETHPLAWTDGQSYAITAEKQAQLTGKLMAATMAQTMSQPYELTWNSTGEVCKAWTLEDLSALAFAIDARVTALVTYQQTKEVEMRDAQDLDALAAVVVDYDTVQ